MIKNLLHFFINRSWMAWFFLWCAFFSVGMIVRYNVSPNATYELYGYDYGTYMVNFASYGFITYMPFRHPLLGLLSAPFIIIGATIAQISPWAYFILLHAMFAMFGTLAAWLVHKIAGLTAVLLFLTIPFVWIASATPESYAVSMCVLLAVVWWAMYQESFCKSEFARAIVWTVLFVVASGVTLTNGVKVVIAYAIANKLSRRQWKWLGIVSLCILFLGVAFFAFRMWMWNVTHPDMQKSIWVSIGQTLARSQTDMTFFGRLKAIICNFFLFPLSMGNPLAVLWAVLLYVAAAVGAWKIRKNRIVWVMGGMFTVDVAIHIICGWALNEAWIFSPHWVWIIPILIGSALKRKEVFA